MLQISSNTISFRIPTMRFFPGILHFLCIPWWEDHTVYHIPPYSLSHLSSSFNIYCPRERNQETNDRRMITSQRRRNGETDRSQLTLWATGVSVTGNAKEILVTRRIASIVPVTALDQSALVFLSHPTSFPVSTDRYSRRINSATATLFVSRNCFAKFRFIDVLRFIFFLPLFRRDF